MSNFSITRNRGFRVKFANGYSVSVQFGTGAYCSRKDHSQPYGIERESEVWESTDAEIAIFDPGGNFFPLPEWGDDVKGWLSADEVLGIMNLVSSWKGVE